MPLPEERVAETLNDVLDEVRKIGANSSTGTLWFRGASSATHELIPRLFRGPETAAVLLGREAEMVSQFKSRSRPLLRGESHSDWGYLFIMQHYGVPTRLLDWSENCFLALYFALSVAAEKGFASDAALWVVDPAAWNAQTFPGMGAPGQALHAESAQLNNYAPGREVDNMTDGAAAMFALYNNPRITAQRGVFTVFGREKDSMEAIFDRKGFPATALTKLCLPQASLESLNAEVRTLGFRESMIYPDLGGLASEIRIGQGLA